jgi:hypothetical protein
MKGSDVLAVMLLISLIGGGVFAGYMLGIMRIGDTPRKDHRIIAEQISAENVPYQINCKLEYAQGDNAVPMDVYEIGPASDANFSYATAYPLTEWRFTINGDTTGYMKIYGPDNDGRVYYLSIVTFSRHHFKVTTPIETVTLTLDNPRYDTIISLVSSS